MPRSTTISATTCCGSSSPPAIRSCRPKARVALTLRLLGGLTTEEIARSFLQSEPTIAQRIVRAKKTIAEARIPFEVPSGLDRNVRLASVLEVIYLIFNEGYSATAGDDWMRPALCDEALRLGRILAELAPNEPEVHGLVALMEIQASRFGARTGPVGRADPLARSEPRALGSAAHPTRTGRPRARGKIEQEKRPLRSAGRDRRLSCAGAQGRRHRLAAHRVLLWRTRAGDALARGRTQSRGRGRHGGRTGGRSCAGRRARRRSRR